MCLVTPCSSLSYNAGHVTAERSHVGVTRSNLITWCCSDRWEVFTWVHGNFELDFRSGDGREKIKWAGDDLGKE